MDEVNLIRFYSDLGFSCLGLLIFAELTSP